MKTLYIPLLIMLLGWHINWAQNNIITGRVVSKVGESVVGATVQVKERSEGTVTDGDGKFEIKGINAPQILVVRCIGYKSQEVQISGNTELKIVLENDDTELNEVLVRGFSMENSQARRRSESVQKIPESVTTFTSDQIEKNGVTNIQSFAVNVPNVSFNTSQAIGVNFISVRGISQIRNGDAPVAFVVDDVFIPDANLINQDLYDLAMVEIVKGPQGALYGKNAIGGAINILTNVPTNNFQHQVSVGLANGNTFNARGSSSGSIVKDKLFYRVSGSFKNAQGLFNNEFLNRKADFLTDKNGRVQLKMLFTPAISTTISGTFIDTQGGAGYYARTKSNADGRMKADDFDNIINEDQLGSATLQNTFVSQNTQIKTSKCIFKIITSLNDAKRYHDGDLDFSSVDILRQYQTSNSNTVNQEVRIMDNNTNDKLKWGVGAFYQYSERYLYTKATADLGFLAAPFTPTGKQSVLAILSDFTNINNSFAVFGFVDYKIVPSLTASLGFRYDNDNIKQNNIASNSTRSKSSNQFQPKITLSYQTTDNSMVYVNYGRGFRSGGFNAANTARFDLDFDAEVSDNYELGFKTSTKDKRFLFNAAGFAIDFNNQQQYIVSVESTGMVLGNYNIPKSLVMGWEADLKWRSSNFLDVLGGIGFTTSTIKEATKKGTTDYSIYNGNKTPFVPSNTFFVALQSQIPLSNNLQFNGLLNLNGKGEIYWHEDNIDVAQPFWLLDARAGLTWKRSYSFTIWGNNLTDTKYYQEYYAKSVSGGSYDIGWKGRPTSFGMDVSIKF